LTKAIIIAAPSSGSGKTLVTLGIARALKNRGLRVATAKVGPDYIDPGFHAAATGEPCTNLDLWAMGEALTRNLLADAAFRHDIILIEGVMGLFDGPRGAKGSTADLAAVFGIPVLLVVDATHQAQSVGALVQGFRNFRKNVHVGGLILNRVKSDAHETMLRDTLKRSRLPLIGALRQAASIQLPSRHLGLVQAQENQQLETVIEDIATRVSRETNLDELLQIATQIPSEPLRQFLTPIGQNIAIARDEAFSFIYPHLLKCWRNAGASISFFSPLHDEAPAFGSSAVFLPGGYPELHAGKIAGNAHFMAALKGFTGTIYGECGGYMVLGEALTDADGATHRMAGLLPVETSFAQKRLHLGYRRLVPKSAPWFKPLRGHEFHYSTIVREGEGKPLFEAQDAAGNTLRPMGLHVGNVFGSYAHVIAEEP
jgi:cobyrinic acid a,c-diamide synthase